MAQGNWYNGALAGTIGTAAMTAAMTMMFKRLPYWQRYSLPPRRITMRVAEKVGVKDELGPREKTAATLAAHFAYGAAMGALYSAGSRKTHAAGAASGITWGTIVWAISYLGILPALGLLSPATRHPLARTALMIIAHWVWGVATGVATKKLESISVASR